MPVSYTHLSLSYDDKALSVLAKKAMGGKHSARDLRRIIRRQVEDPIANLLVDHYREPKKAISISANGEEITVIGL